MNIDIIKILKDYNIKGIKNSNVVNVSCCCPFHNDKTPSFCINKETGLYVCYACGEKGNIYHLISKLSGRSYNEVKKSFFVSKNDYYNLLLNNISKKFIDNKKVNKEHKVNYNGLKPISLFKKGNYMDYIKKLNISENIAIKANLCVDTEKYKDMLAIPIICDGKKYWELRDVFGNNNKKVQYLYGMKVSDMIYHIKVNNSNNYFLVEGSKDVLTIAGYGYNALCCFGTNVSNEQIKRMLSLNICKLYIMYDGDDAGKKAYNKNINILKNYFNCYKIECPECKDPNDLSEKQFLECLKTEIKNG